MSSVFVEILPRDFGMLDCGARCFGGLLRDPCSSLENPRYVSTHNLSLFWNRSLTAQAARLSECICDAPSVLERFNRPPLSIRFDHPPESLWNRNLMSLTTDSDGKTILWNVVDRSNRRRLVQWKVKYRHEEAVKLKRRAEEDLEVPILELKKSTQGLFLRSHDRLLWRDENGIVKTVWSGGVNHFEENTLINDELRLIDDAGRIWSGDWTQSTMHRTKNGFGDTLSTFCGSDHPRVLRVASDYDIRTFDLRQDSAVRSSPLFTLPRLEVRSKDEPQWVHTEIFAESPKVRRLCSIQDSANSFICLTDKKLFILDDRMPREALLRYDHSFSRGGDVFIQAEPVSDINNAGRMRSFFVMDHLKSELGVITLYQHGVSSVFSTTDPVYRWPSSNLLLHLLKKRRVNWHSKMRCGPVRSIGVCTEDKDGVHLLFKAMDDGSIWSDVVQYSDGSKDEVFQASYDRIDKWMSEDVGRSSPWEEACQSFHTEKPNSKSTLVHVERELSIDHWNHMKLKAEMNPLAIRWKEELVKQPVQAETIADAAIFSQVFTKMWLKPRVKEPDFVEAPERASTSIHHPLSNPADTEMDIDEDVDVDPLALPYP